MVEVLNRVAGPNGGLTPLQAIRQECLDCCGGSANEVRLCVSKSCASWPFRLGKRPTAELRAEVADMVLHPQERGITGREFHENGGTALQAIKLKCLDCSGNIPSEVRDCKFTSCGLHPLRFGKNPNRVYSEDAKAALAERGRQALARMRSLPGNEPSNPDPGASA